MEVNTVVKLLWIAFAFVVIILIMREGTKNDRYSNKIVQDIKTNEKFVYSVYDIVEVGDTITIFIDTAKVTVKVIK